MAFILLAWWTHYVLHLWWLPVNTTCKLGQYEDFQIIQFYISSKTHFMHTILSRILLNPDRKTNLQTLSHFQVCFLIRTLGRIPYLWFCNTKRLPWYKKPSWNTCLLPCPWRPWYVCKEIISRTSHSYSTALVKAVMIDDYCVMHGQTPMTDCKPIHAI